MITNNLKKISAGLFCANVTKSAVYAFIPITDISGATKYYSYYGDAFPGTLSQSFSTTANSAGIKVGSGTTPATANDYNLGSQITSGISGSISRNRSVDSNGNPIASLLVTITNTGSAPVTIGEIGYFAEVRVSATSDQTSGSTGYTMIDRTVLDNPITIPASGAATITYALSGIWNEGA